MLPSFRRTITNAYKKPPVRERGKKNASYFTITFSLFALSFFGMLAIRPTLITVFSLRKSVTELKKLNIEYENKISSVVRAQSEYEQIRDAIPLIEDAIPQKATFNKLAQALEDFANRSAITINQLQIDNVPISQQTGGNKLQIYNFSLIAIGDYPSLFSYTTHLLNFKRIINITTLDLSQEGSTVSGNLRLTLKGSTYYGP